MSSPAQVRSPPPPPPPTAAPMALEEPDEGESEYEGDYDTDIGSSEKHKDALKEANFDDNVTVTDVPFRSPAQPPAVPPPPSQRAVPPPPPHIPITRTSVESPRIAPPPVPPPRNVPTTEEEHGYYGNYTRYQDSTRGAPPPPPSLAPAPPLMVEEPQDLLQESSDDLYDVSPPRQSVDRPPPPPPQAVLEERAVPAPPTHAAPPPIRAPPRQSLDVARTSTRHSIEVSKPMNDGYIATDVDLAEQTQWWARKDQPPPVFQGRSDVLCEIEESSTSKRGGKTTVSKDVYVLFPDYSQTVITARFDSRDLGDVSLEQRHEAPPARLRQDQLEQYWQRFGARIADAAALTKDKVVGDGTPNALVLDLIRALNGALLPVGTRAYGALVYANLANASVQQFDEIRAGDIITLRNAKLQGKHGTMHQKYSMDVGAATGGPQGAAQGHVAVVLDWDGTKKKVRAWEQGREKNKVRLESFRLGDLRSGEVRVWRVVGRPWVGWE